MHVNKVNSKEQNNLTILLLTKVVKEVISILIMKYSVVGLLLFSNPI